MGIPAPNGEANADPSGDQAPNPTPEGETTPGSRPDWVPEDAWDAESGAPNMEKLAEAFNAKGVDADVPEGDAIYTPPAIEGVEADVISGNPTYQNMAKLAKTLGIGQARFEEAAKGWIEGAIKDEEGAAERLATELGENAPARLQAIANWAAPKLTTDEFAALQNSMTDAKSIIAIEKLMKGGVSTAPRNPPPPSGQRKSKAEIETLMASDAYGGPPAKRDPKVIAEVTKWFEDEHK